MPTYQMIKALVNTVEDLAIDKDHLMIISPDEGAMQRCIYFATQLGVNLGMFYKRRDYTTIINGRNPIVEHQYLGDSVNGKDIIIVDDMISSGESMFAQHLDYSATVLRYLTMPMQTECSTRYSQQTVFINLLSFFQENGMQVLSYLSTQHTLLIP